MSITEASPFSVPKRCPTPVCWRHAISSVELLADRPDVVQALIKNKVRFAVMSPKEQTTDVPEHSDLKPKDYWDKRARGLGATRYRPAVSCGEENLLNLKRDRYYNENILIHEFAHAIHEMGLNSLDPKFDARLKTIFTKAIEQGLWKKTYAATNHKEYWAEGVQSYFDCNAPAGGVHNDINTREKLAKYDPELFKIIDEVFKQSKFRYVRYDKRKRAETKKEPLDEWDAEERGFGGFPRIRSALICLIRVPPRPIRWAK